MSGTTSTTGAGGVKDPADTSGRLIAASKVNGTTVYDAGDQNLGSVEDIMIDKMSGQVEYAILSFGGFLGIGSDYYPLPWQKLTYDTSLGGFRIDITKEMLDRAPKYSRDTSWSDWGSVDAYYG
jgi:sporulation protein YlmC with PRC-barrel domain